MFFIICTLISLVGLGATLLYARTQTRIARTQTRIAREQTQIAIALAKNQDEQQREVQDWLERHENVGVQLSRVSPQLMVVVYETGVETTVYPSVFLHPQLRSDIEQLIVEPVDNHRRFVPRRPTELELRSPALRETVQKVENIFADCRTKQPELYKYYA